MKIEKELPKEENQYSRFRIELPVNVLEQYMNEMIRKYAAMPEAKSKGETEYSKAKKTIFVGILNLQGAIKTLKKHQF